MTDTNLNFRANFYDFYFTKTNFAYLHASAYIESLNLNKLKFYQQVLKLKEEKELHKKKIDDFERKEYLIFADNEHQLYNVFIAHLLFYNKNEKSIIEECLILNETYKLLNKVLLETIAQLPLFTLTDCLNNKKNVVFYELNQQPFGTSNEEYSKMRNWQTNQKIPTDSCFDQLFDPTFEEGICQGKKAIAEFESKYFSQKIKENKYHSVILHKQNKIRSGLKMLGYPEYFQFMDERENVKRIFLNNCIVNIDIEDQQLELIKTIVLYEKNKFIDNELFMMDEEIICTQIDYDFIVHQMKNMLSIMVPDCELINQWQQAFTLAEKSMMNRMPILFIIEDLVDAFKGIYRQAVNKFQLLFFYQSSERKVTYISEQINDLIHLESNIPEKGPIINAIITDLIIHFRTEVENVLLQKNNKLTKIEDLLHETKIQDETPSSFGYKKALGYLTPFIPKLNVAINLLDNRTNKESFERIITTSNLGTITEKIYLGCQTNEFAYLIKHFKVAFKHFNPATIGKSGLFISNTGHIITADCLYNSKMDNLQTKIAIDNIFNKK